MKARVERRDRVTWPIYKRLLGYVKPFWPIMAVAVAGMALDAAALTTFVNLIKPLLDDLFVHRDPTTIFWMPILIVGIFAIRGVASFAQRYGLAYVGLNVVQQMQVDIFNHYMRLGAEFFSREAAGHQIARITYTSQQISYAATTALKDSVTESLTVIGMVGLMLYTSAYLTLALFILVPVVGLVVTVVSWRYRRLSRNVQGMMGEITGHVEEAVNGQREVKIYGGQSRETRGFFRAVKRTRHLNLKVQLTNALASVTVQTVAAMSLAVIIFLATRPSMVGEMTAGDFTRMIMAMGAIVPSMKRLASVQGNIQQGMAAAEELFAVLDETPEVDRGTRPLRRAHGDLRFDNVVLRYPRAEQDALRGITLDCPHGSVTALVGRSGSGKSTMASLIPRLYDTTSGQVLLDGHPVTDYPLLDLRRQMAWVGQSVVLFDDTVAGNIAYGELGGASEEAIIAAAEAANAMEFIGELPQGIHTPIGQGGNLLSGGQRQRIAIARAILKDAPVLILDEATSALDTQSEHLIQQALARLMQRRTTIVIAHRLSTVENADQIAVLEHGRIIELGTHRELLALDGQYASLYHMQFHDVDAESTAATGSRSDVADSRA